MIYLLAGHTPKGVHKDPGAVANGYEEATLTMELRDKVADILRAAGEKVYEDNDELRLGNVLLDVKSIESDVVVDLHFNAGPVSATGVEVLVPSRSTEYERGIARKICADFAEVMQIPSRGIKSEGEGAHKTLGVMRELGINVLVEVCFVTNAKDMASFTKNKNVLATKLATIIQQYEKQITA